MKQKNYNTIIRANFYYCIPRIVIKYFQELSQRYFVVTLEIVVIIVCAKSLQSCPTLCDPMDCSLTASSVHRISRQEYWNGLPYPPPGDLLGPEIEPASLMSPALAGGFSTTSINWESERKLKVPQSCPTLRPHVLYSPWNSLGQDSGVGSLSLLQGIFPTQGSNPGLPHCRQILYQLNHKGSPRIQESVAFQPRNRTGVSCIAGRFFTNWVIRESTWEACCYYYVNFIISYDPFSHNIDISLLFINTHSRL